ncbi:MAG: four helix bundle protein [Patescibacteria group bacterium]
MKYDLEERTAKFGESTIDFVQGLSRSVINLPLVSQIVRSATSIGANYCEANNASSRKDFINKIFICKKEASEIKHWLRMIARANNDKKDALQKLWGEAHELTMIFSKIISSSKV